MVKEKLDVVDCYCETVKLTDSTSKIGKGPLINKKGEGTDCVCYLGNVTDGEYKHEFWVKKMSFNRSPQLVEQSKNEM